jgi:ATP-dependent helicase HrpA
MQESIKLTTYRNKIKKIESLLPGVLAVDRLKARRDIRRLITRKGRAWPDEKIEKRLLELEKRLKASSKKRNRRRAHLPPLRFNEALPIFSKKDEIIEAIERHPVIVVSGETGSGKTTQLPQYCLAAGRGIDGLIGCTQPRRIAATTVSRRIAEELGPKADGTVGYKIRFKDRTRKEAFIKIMTDGILLAETQGDRHLGAYDTIIVDEAHERSLNIDFILGILQTLVNKRNDLKLIITSATIDTEKFSKAFGNAPVIEVSGRMYPVDVQYLSPETDPSPNGELTHVELAVQAVKRVLSQSHTGDMLVFMPTEQDIRETCELLEAQLPEGTRVMPLFARLTAAEQSRVFARLSRRKIIVATNVAETSITIPGIKYVIDSGLARISRYSPSCDQRKGRCGRVQNGICLRLYSEDDYQARPEFTPPEIIRANLAEVILRMISLELGDVLDFPFIDRPDLKSIKDGFNLLSELGAIVERPKAKGESSKVKGQRPKVKGIEQTRSIEATGTVAVAKSNKHVVLTDKGRLMAKIPLDPRLSRMLIEAKQERCLAETVIIAAALSIQDARERPIDKTAAADRMHAGFDDPNSDFVTLLNIWGRYHAHRQKVKSNNQMKKFCREHFLSFKRMREWRDIHSQILAILKEHDLVNSDFGLRNADLQRRKAEMTDGGNLNISENNYERIHKAVLSGFLSNIALQKEKNIFRAGKGKDVMIFPGSGLFNKARPWVVAAEMVETSRVFARTVANIDNVWLEALGGDLCRRTYLEPHWEKNRGEVVALEQVSLFGLIIEPGRKISYGKVNPSEASEIFIQSALVNGDIKKPFAFMQHNQRLIEDILDIENRFRRRDLLIEEQHIYEFYQERLPGIYDIRSLSKFLKQRKNDRFLRLEKDALLAQNPDDEQLDQYPDRLDIGNNSLECAYCFNPGKDDDGVTLKIPSALAPSVSPESIDWLVPGLYPQKIEALIKGLPKMYRRKLVPVKNTVDVIIHEMPKSRTSLISALGEFIYRRFDLDIPAAAWPEESLPDYLKMRVAITAPDGKELQVGRDPAILRQADGGLEKSDELKAARAKWEKTGITRWDFGDLPESVSDTGKEEGRWIAYPALEPSGAGGQVNLRLFRQPEKALTVHLGGVAALYTILFAKDLKFLRRQLTLPADKAFMADYFGGVKNLVNQMIDRIIQDLFRKNIRSQEAFYAHVESVAPKISSTGQELLDGLVPILTAYHDARSQIHKLQQSSRQNSQMVSFFQEQTAELGRLVPKTFISIYDKQRLDHLIRYIQAATIRARRAAVDFEKDHAKSKGVAKFTEGLNQLLNGLSPRASDEKRRVVEEYFWMIEEYKVSVFAQELKTAIPISAKRLEQKLGEIKRMA